MTGTMQPRGTRLVVSVDSTSLLGIHTMWLKKEVGKEIVTAQYQIPSTARRSFQIDCDVREGTQLMISLGLRDEAGRLSDVATLANSALARVGLPQYQPATHTKETCVLITPLHGLPEKERSDWHPFRSRVRMTALQ
jgi:hypothetical protein